MRALERKSVTHLSIRLYVHTSQEDVSCMPSSDTSDKVRSFAKHVKKVRPSEDPRLYQ